MSSNERQFCAICAWRENCAKKFCIPDGGARCPDYSRDISIKNPDADGDNQKKQDGED